MKGSFQVVVAVTRGFNQKAKHQVNLKSKHYSLCLPTENSFLLSLHLLKSYSLSRNPIHCQGYSFPISSALWTTAGGLSAPHSSALITHFIMCPNCFLCLSHLLSHPLPTRGKNTLAAFLTVYSSKQVAFTKHKPVFLASILYKDLNLFQVFHMHNLLLIKLVCSFKIQT